MAARVLSKSTGWRAEHTLEDYGQGRSKPEALEFSSAPRTMPPPSPPRTSSSFNLERDEAEGGARRRHMSRRSRSGNSSRHSSSRQSGRRRPLTPPRRPRGCGEAELVEQKTAVDSTMMAGPSSAARGAAEARPSAQAVESHNEEGNPQEKHEDTYQDFMWTNPTWWDFYRHECPHEQWETLSKSQKAARRRRFQEEQKIWMEL